MKGVQHQLEENVQVSAKGLHDPVKDVHDSVHGFHDAIKDAFGFYGL